MILRTCLDCNLDLSPSAFGVDRRRKDGLSTRCLDCKRIRLEEWRSKNPGRSGEYYVENKERIQERNTKWRKENPEKWKAARFKRRLKKYGLTVSEFEKIRNKQDNSCAICLFEFKSTSDFHIDHCHTSGHIRGLLCKNCNMTLGKAQDSVEFFERAIVYLKRTKLKAVV